MMRGVEDYRDPLRNERHRGACVRASAAAARSAPSPWHAPPAPAGRRRLQPERAARAPLERSQINKLRFPSCTCSALAPPLLEWPPSRPCSCAVRYSLLRSPTHLSCSCGVARSVALCSRRTAHSLEFPTARHLWDPSAGRPQLRARRGRRTCGMRRRTRQAARKCARRTSRRTSARQWRSNPKTACF